MSITALLAIRLPPRYVQKRIDKKRRAMRLRDELPAPHVPKRDRKLADHEQFRLTGEGATV